MKRSGKFYRKNENEVMKQLGLKPTSNSGSGWVEKEDGQNDFVICQLKSTDAQSIRITQEDIAVLEYNANVTRKIPVFAIQFLNNFDVFLLCRPEDILDISQYIKAGTINVHKYDAEELQNFVSANNNAEKLPQGNFSVKSSPQAREKARKELEKKYKKEGKSAK